MKSHMFSWALAIAALTLFSATTAMAQPGGGRGFGRGFGMGGGGVMDPTMLLSQESVQKDLDLTEDQKSQVTKLSDESRQARRDLFQSGAAPEEMQKKMQDMAKDNKKKVDDILLPKQVDRLSEIELQYAMSTAPADALSQDDLAGKLSLTDDEKGKIKDLVQENRDKMREIFDNAQGDFQGIREKMTKLREEEKDKAMAMLTDEQKSKLEKLEGKKFDTSTIQMFRGGRRGGGGGGQPGA